MRVILTVGLPASGKSTWAKQFVRDNPGTIRFNNDEFSYMTTGYDDGRSFEPMDGIYLGTMRRAALEWARDTDTDIVLDNTNLSPNAVNEAVEVTRAEVERVFFRVDYMTCIYRNTQRGELIPNSVIATMARRYNHRYDWIRYEG